MQLLNRKMKMINRWFLIAVILCSSFMSQFTTAYAAGDSSVNAGEGLFSALGAGDNPTSSGDAYVRYEESEFGKVWTMGTGQIEKVVRLQDGKFQMTSLVNKLAGGQFGKEYLNPGSISDEFAIKTVIEGNSNGLMLSGSNETWNLEHYSTALGSQQELLLSVSLTSPTMRVTRNYQMLPDTGVIEEWTGYTNLNEEPATYAEPSFIRSRIMPDATTENAIVYRMVGDKVSSSPKHTLVQEPVKTNGLTTIDGSGADVSHPFVALQNKNTQDGVFFTWDYTGKWQAKVGNSSGMTFIQAAVYNRLDEENWTFSLQPNETVSMPLSRVGVFVGDTDDMGNAITDYQYKYKWEHTNEDFMNIIRFGGYGSDPELIFQKVNSNRYIGGDMIWIDDGWQTNLGDWEWKEGMPIEKYQEYIAKNSQVLGLWMPPWGAEQHAQLMKNHPEWYIEYKTGMDVRKTGLDTSNPEVVNYIRSKVNEVEDTLGGFMLKTDFNQYKDGFLRAQGVMQVMSNFKLDHPNQGLHICSDGSGVLNPGSASLSELILLQDGTPAYSDGYYASMLYPIDKIMTSRGRGDIGSYSKSNRSMLSYAMTVAGKTNGTMEELEPVRKDMDLYRYLKDQGVMGRYVKVYRPSHTLEADRYYFVQKMNKDGDKGYITVRFDPNFAGANMTLTPKGLDAASTYTISTLEDGMATATKTGAEWMTEGIALTPLQVGEVIFLNLENRPGTGYDQIAPESPVSAFVSNARYMDRSGVELVWDEGLDNNWVSYYEIFKNGKAYDKVSKGTYYFDVNGTLNDHYSIRTVDGDGNASDQVAAAQHAPSIHPNVAEFDKAPNRQADVETEITWNRATQVTDIKLNGASIGSGSYVVGQTEDGQSTLTIKKDLLAAQEVGNLELTVEFDQGYKQLLIVQIVDKSGTTSGDAYVRFEDLGNEKIWMMGTDQIEKVVRIQNSKLIMTSLVNKLAPNGGREYSTHPKTVSDEFAIKPVVPGNTSAPIVTGNDSVWTYESHSVTKGAQGELILSVSVTGKSMRVTRNYQILPDTGVIEEWTDYTNLKQVDAIFGEPRLVRYRVMPDAADKVDLYHLNVKKTGEVTEQVLVQQPVNKSSLTTIEGSDTEINYPFFALQYRDDQDGLFFTWDYSGKWTTKVGNNSGMTFAQVAVYNKLDTGDWTFTVAPDETFSSPVSRVGVFAGDTDDLGNAITDYQYKYKWSDTNEVYLNQIQYDGAVADPDPVFERISNNRYIGGDLVWLEDGWQTNVGDWGWRAEVPVGQYQHYANMSGQSLGLWLPPWGAEQASRLKQEHPDWFIEYKAGMDPRKTGLDTSKPEVVQYIQDKLGDLQDEFGGFALKTDFNLYKDGYSRAQGVQQALKNYKQSHPDIGLYITSNGSDLLHPGSAAYSESIIPQEGVAGFSDGYYTSLLYPIDKLVTTNGRGELGSYTKSNRALLSYQMTVAGVADDREGLELIRQDADLYRYLKTQGVMGRYVKVYRPKTDTNGPYYFVQKVSPNGSKSYMTVRFDPALEGTNVKVYPKGLKEEQAYTVSTLEGGMGTATKTGAEWMDEGILLTPLKTGEVVFLNLEGRPGSGSDQTAPLAPEVISAGNAQYMGRSGTEIVWGAGFDENWISYYEIEKNGVPYDRVSKGTRYFDAGALTGDSYRIRTVDGDGNASEYVPAASNPNEPALNPSRASFDKNPEKQVSVVIGVTWNSASDVVAVTYGGVTVTEDVYYTVTGNLITIKSGYLAMQKIGDLTLTVVFDTGHDAEVTITIVDTSGGPPEPPIVDKSKLHAAISEAQSRAENAEIGDRPGQYPAAAMDALNASIAVAVEILNQATTQEAIDAGVLELYRAISDFDDAKLPTESPFDETAPIWPEDKAIIASNVGKTNLTLSWTPAIDDKTVTNYKVYLNGVDIATVTGSVYSYTVTGLASNTSYTFKVEAGDAAGNWSTEGPNLHVTTQADVVDGGWTPISTPNPGPVNPVQPVQPKPKPGSEKESGTETTEPADPTAPDASPRIELKDIAGHWAKDSIEEAVELGFVTGYGDETFRPNALISRAEIAAMLTRALKLELIDAELSFADKDTMPMWAQPFIRAIVKAGFVSGYEDGTFRANKEITRTELVVIIVRALGLEMNSNAKIAFSDSEQIPLWARPYVAAAVERGLIKGDGSGRFNPNHFSTRAEAITLILALLNNES